MDNNIFRRVEKKYLLTQAQKKKLIKEISKYVVKDKYYKSNILNIYYDTKNFDLIINSIDKPVYKEKVRLRSYEIPNMDSKVFLEIKSKYKGVVGKRRVELTLKEFYDFLDGKYNNSQILKEIDYLFKYYDLVPAIFIGYDRLSFRGKEDSELRITFDSNLKSRFDDLKLESGNHGNKYFKDNLCIMEIKTLGAIPLWFTRILSEEKIYPSSFSKYGSIYSKRLEESSKNVK